MKNAMPDNPHYDPKKLLDTLHQILRVPNDRRLAGRLGVQPPVISKIRRNHLAPTPALLISMHEETNMGLRDLRALMGDFRPHTGPSASHPTHAQLEAMRRMASGRGRFMEALGSAST